ncbi:hypothetical protein [Candidatus Chlamydia corallus]|uniref:hypothetical protein n=1 Tax=Candidatus Chlamydia corallus TaxID=2038470 RepID=UPI000C2FB9ED|nr:hypothetical protein [Candidatus Chlamydia corallus]
MTWPCGNLNCFYREQPRRTQEEDIPLQEQGQSSNQGQHTITQQPGSQNQREMGFSIEPPGNVLHLVEQAGSLVEKLLDNARMQRLGNYCYRTGTPWCKTHCPSFLQWIWGGCCACCLDTENTPENPQAQFLKELVEKFGPICVGMVFQQTPNCANKIEKGENLSPTEQKMLEDLCKCQIQALKKTPQKCMAESMAKVLGNQELGEDILIKDLFFQLFTTVIEAKTKGAVSTSSPPNCWILQASPTLPSPSDEEQLQGAVGGAPASTEGSGDCRTTCKLNYKTFLRKLSRLEVFSLESGYTGPLGQASISVLDLIKKTLKLLVGPNSKFFTFHGIGLSLESHVFEILVILCLLAHGYIPLDPLDEKRPCIDPEKDGPWQKRLQELLTTTERGKKSSSLGRSLGLQSAAFGLGRRQVDERDGDGRFSHGSQGAGLGLPLPPGEEEEEDEIDPWSPDNQQMLLQGSQKVSSCFKLG